MRYWAGLALGAVVLAGGSWSGGDVVAQTRTQTAADNGAVVLMYHRFDQPDQPQTNIRMDQFAQHLAELKNGGYTVMALPAILERLRNRERLPDRTVAITVNDATTDLYSLAWPKFRDAGFPITVFVASDFVDRAAPGMMTWDQVRELAAAGVTIGSQTASVAHLPEIEIDQVKLEIDRASNRIQAETGRRPVLLAYPYGEFGSAVQKVVAERGYVAAFGQQSGVMNPASDRYGLPRFALNETYGGIDRFRLVVNALPLPVTERVPADLVVRQNPPPFGFTVDPGIGSTANIDCYASDVGRTRIERLGDRVEVRLSAPFPPGRARINCTMPGPDDRWRWYGVQFFIPG
ncbi:MAG: polysaccharide deacetylase family protein [Alphaproteobacteria bacterium]|nr:polysaccharide deacetylase family protein [Alphaproteobacteria bacterium]